MGMGMGIPLRETKWRRVRVSCDGIEISWMDHGLDPTHGDLFLSFFS
jgi:hypothetical protein